MAQDAQEIWSLKVDKKGVVWIVGEVDYTATPKLRATLLTYIEKTEGELHLNLSRLAYLDSSGLAVLIEARRNLQERKRALVVDTVTPEVKKIFDLTQVGKLFGV